jgi:protoheme IX farnesyltransferase
VLVSEQTRTRFSVVLAYVRLTKPRIIELLLVTTVPVMVLADGGWPSSWLVVSTVLGGTLSAAGANTLNNVCDRDIDRLMDRTSHRPLVTEQIPVANALVFGVALGLGGHVWLSLAVGQLAAWLTTAALLFYVLVYTLVLKRRTPQNIVIGGAAGAVPVLVGWAAVTGTVSFEALMLFTVVCLWTPPHFWALAIRYRDDYRNAAVPMLPVVAGVDATLRQIKIYALLTAIASLSLIFGSAVGAVYLVPAAALGGWFVVGALRLSEERAMSFFRDSIVYLSLLFAVITLEGFFGSPI